MCVVLIHSSHVQFGWTALMIAARYGHTAIVQYLVEETTAQVNATDNRVSHSNSVSVLLYIGYLCINTSIIGRN